MRVAIIGTGRLGTAVGDAWKLAGYDVVTTASRTPSDVEAVVAGADFIVLAIPFEAVADLARGLAFDGNILIDATNGGGDYSTSGAERVAAAFPKATVCKALNTVFAPEYAKVSSDKGSASMLFCGDDDGAKRIVARALTDIGFDAIDAGPLASARFIEALGMLVIAVAYRMGRGPFTYKFSAP